MLCHIDFHYYALFPQGTCDKKLKKCLFIYAWLQVEQCCMLEDFVACSHKEGVDGGEPNT